MFNKICSVTNNIESPAYTKYFVNLWLEYPADYPIYFFATYAIYESVVRNLLLPWRISWVLVMSMFERYYTYIMLWTRPGYSRLTQRVVVTCFYAILMPKHSPKSLQTSPLFAHKVLTTILEVCDLIFWRCNILIIYTHTHT